MERYLQISLVYGGSANDLLKQLRSLVTWCRDKYGLDEYRLARMGFKRIGSHVSCRMEFNEKSE